MLPRPGRRWRRPWRCGPGCGTGRTFRWRRGRAGFWVDARWRGDQFQFNAGLDLLPVLLQHLPLEFAQSLAWGAHDVVCFPAAQLGNVLVADHATVEHPGAPRATVALFHQLHHAPDRCGVVAVALEHLIGQRQTLGCDHQPNEHLQTIGPRIPGVTTAAQGTGGHLPLEKCGGRVIKRDIELAAEQLAIGPAQMTKQGLTVDHQHIERTVEPVIVDQCLINAQQIIKGGAPEERLRNGQIARGLTQPRHAVDRSHQRPGHLLAPGLHHAREKLIQPQPLPQRQRHIHIPETPHLLHTHPPRTCPVWQWCAGAAPLPCAHSQRAPMNRRSHHPCTAACVGGMPSPQTTRTPNQS